jgi:hypothetical protein
MTDGTITACEGAKLGRIVTITFRLYWVDIQIIRLAAEGSREMIALEWGLAQNMIAIEAKCSPPS